MIEEIDNQKNSSVNQIKIIIILILLFVIAYIEMSGFPNVPMGIGLTFEVNSNDWYEFTEDNIESNSDLDTLGITSEYMENLFETTDAYVIYVKKDVYSVDNSNVELIVSVEEDNHEVNNLTDRSDSEIDAIAKEYLETNNGEDYQLYRYKSNTFIKTEYYQNDHYIMDFYTIRNHRAYIMRFQESSEPPRNYEYYDIVKTADFNYEPPYNELSFFLEVFIGIILISCYLLLPPYLAIYIIKKIINVRKRKKWENKQS